MEAAAAPTSPEAHPAETGGVASLQPGRPLVGRFAVARKDRQQSKAGTPYLSLELRDRTGSIPARIFREADQLGARFERGDAIEARGRVERFRGQLSAEITALRRLEPGAYDPAEFLPSAYRSVEELEGFLEHLTGEIYDPALRALVEAVCTTEPVASELRRAPCTRGGHHAYLGGLLEHTVSVGTMVGDLCQLHPKLDSDLLMAAALLHDIGKTREFTYGAEFGISEEGALLGTCNWVPRSITRRRSARRSRPSAGSRCCIACSATTAPRPRGGRAATPRGSPRRRRSRWRGSTRWTPRSRTHSSTAFAEGRPHHSGRRRSCLRSA